MLETVGLTKQYGNHTALDHLSLRVDPGEIFCLLGANGAGKTTTISLLLNFIQPTFGTACGGKLPANFIRAINDDITKNAVGKAAYIRGDDLWKSIPEFRYTSPGLGWVLSREWSSLLILAVWTAVAAVFAYVSVTRLRVD